MSCVRHRPHPLPSCLRTGEESVKFDEEFQVDIVAFRRRTVASAHMMTVEIDRCCILASICLDVGVSECGGLRSLYRLG